MSNSVRMLFCLEPSHIELLDGFRKTFKRLESFELFARLAGLPLVARRRRNIKES